MTEATPELFVFLGPSLALDEARVLLPGACFCPPVAQGDVVGLLPRRPAWIGIIDGYFESTPAVWHKELLLALEQGIRVAGAASMGALRAAELAAFGMEGVGEIFAAYRDGEIVGDDEVALRHGDAASGYRRLSEALVNVRSTLRAAERCGALAPVDAARLLARAAAMPYAERTWPAILRDVPDTTREQLRAGFVDQKAADARALLRHIRDAPPRARVPRAVARTRYLGNLLHADAPVAADPTGRTRVQDVIDHARLELAELAELLDTAACHELIVQLAHHLGIEAAPWDRERVEGDMAREFGWRDDADRAAWCRANDLDPDAGEALIERRALLEVMKRRFLEPRNAWLLAELKLSGRYPALARAAVEAPAAAELRAREPTLDELLVERADRRGEQPPEDLDAWMLARGIAGRGELRRLLRRTWRASQAR